MTVLTGYDFFIVLMNFIIRYGQAYKTKATEGRQRG